MANSPTCVQLLLLTPAPTLTDSRALQASRRARRLPSPNPARRPRQLYQGALDCRSAQSGVPCPASSPTRLPAQVLVATDTHIGYAEKDPVRGRDSINTFKEVLDLAVANDVRRELPPLRSRSEAAS